MGVLLDIATNKFCDMKYIIMCGGKYNSWKTPRQLTNINGESIVARTIRLLREAGINNIAISTNLEGFDDLGVEILHHENDFGISRNAFWLDAFYPADEPVCYLFGDVVFSKNAINTIINVETNDIQFFASAPPFSSQYSKVWAEPFAFKVIDQKHFREAIEEAKMIYRGGRFKREPIAWELWQVIKRTPLNEINYTNYQVINDWTCDVDKFEDSIKIQEKILE